jgi:hypothetical protein
LIQTLSVKFFPCRDFQNDALQCLSEIGALQLDDKPQYNVKFKSMFGAVVMQVGKLLTEQVDIVAEHARGDPSVTVVLFYHFTRSLRLP